MRQYYFGGQIYTESTLTDLTADLDSELKRGGIDVNTSAKISNGMLVVRVPVAIQGMSEDDIPIVIQAIIIGRDNMPYLPLGGFTVAPNVTTNLESIDDLYRLQAHNTGLKRCGHVRSILNTTSGIEITIG